MHGVVKGINFDEYGFLNALSKTLTNAFLIFYKQ